MKKAKLAMAIVTVFVLAAELCFGVFASSSASYNITGTITYEVENNITANTSVTSLSASRTCSHKDPTGNVSASNGVNISDYFTVVLNGSTLTNDDIKSNVSSGTLSVTPATGLTYDSSTGKVYMTPSQITSTNGDNVSNSYTLTLTYDSNTKASVSIPTTATVGSWSSTASGNYDATCTAKGWKNKTVCSKCSKVITAGSSINALGHSWETTGTETTPATCENAGVRTYNCTRSGCSETKTESIDALGHSWNSGKVTTAATCTTNGVRTYTCSTCGGTKTKTISATGHTEGTVETSYSNTNSSYHTITYTTPCSVCGATISSSSTTENHSKYRSGWTSSYYGLWSSWTTTTAATCTSTGTKTRSRDCYDYPIYSCRYCSYGYTGTTKHYYDNDTETDTIQALGHDFSSTYTVDKEATCTTDGSKSQHCSRCSATQNSTTIDATGHTPGSKEPNTINYSNGGYSQCSNTQHYYYWMILCTKCGKQISKGTSKENCDKEETASAVAATCKTTGSYAQYTCKICGKVTGGGPISKIAHDSDKRKFEYYQYECTYCGEITRSKPDFCSGELSDGSACGNTSFTRESVYGIYCSMCNLLRSYKID